MDIALMIEGQNGLNWPRWQALAPLAEALGFSGLYRSDHFTNGSAPDKDSLELWTSLTWLASHTQKLIFGPLVSPMSFRHPVFTARVARDVDDLSGGRLRLGVGAGWQEREHANFGFDLLDVSERFARFAEGLEVITRLLHSEDPVMFAGRYYHLQEARLLPRPMRAGGPELTVGGNGMQRTLPLVARYADTWNAGSISLDRFRALNAHLTELLQARGRAPESVRRTFMAGVVFGADAEALERRLHGRAREHLRARGAVVGTPDEVRAQLAEMAEAGVQEVMLQWLDLDDLEGLKQLAAAVL